MVLRFVDEGGVEEIVVVHLLAPVSLLISEMVVELLPHFRLGFI